MAKMCKCTHYRNVHSGKRSVGPCSECDCIRYTYNNNPWHLICTVLGFVGMVVIIHIIPVFTSVVVNFLNIVELSMSLGSTYVMILSNIGGLIISFGIMYALALHTWSAICKLGVPEEVVDNWRKV